MSEYAVVGKSLPRVDAVEKATGSARYGADLFVTGMLMERSCAVPIHTPESCASTPRGPRG